MNVCLRGADNIMDKIGYRASPYVEYCWRFITLCVSTGSEVKYYIVSLGL